MRSLILVAVAGLHLGTAELDTKFMRPRDPAMDEVANILEGILSNLTKHKGYIQVTPALLARVQALSKADHSRLVGLLTEQIHATSSASLLRVVADVRAAEPAATLRSVLTNLHITASDQAVLFVDDAEQCGHYSAAAEAAAKTLNVLVVNASGITAPGVVDRVPEMYFVPKDTAALPRRFAGAYSREALRTFLADHSAGSPEPRTQARALVHTGTARAGGNLVTSIDEAGLAKAVGASGDDMFVVFFAPWCAHCKDFVVAAGGPLNQLGTALSNNGAAGSLQVLKMDVSSQPTIPSMFGQVQYIPAIFFVPADRSRAIAHAGAQDVGALLAFIEQNAQSAKSLFS